MIGFFIGGALSVYRFPGNRLIVILINALMGLPPVVVGLMVYLLLSRSGPLGVLGLLYTPTAMIIAQVFLVAHPLPRLRFREILRIKNLAISRQKDYSIVFDVANNTYEIQDENANVIDHPMTGRSYTVNFANESRLSRVTIGSVSFDSSATLTYDYLGSPYNGASTPLNSGQIVLEADDYSMTITIQAVTGYLTIQ